MTMTSQQIQSWETADWDELIAVWNELVPDPQGPALKPIRRFRGSEISPQDAGIVFERWIIGAFKAGGADVHFPYRVTMPDPGDERTFE